MHRSNRLLYNTILSGRALLLFFLPCLLMLFAAVETVRAEQQVAYGSYPGNGSSSRQITVGFQPDFVLVKSTSASYNAVIRTPEMWLGTSKPVGADESAGWSMISSLDSSGFTVGNNSRVNRNGSSYHWVAVRGSSDTIASGQYTGNRVDNRQIGGLGFEPRVVLVLPANNDDASLRCASMPDGQSARLRDKDLESNHIQGFYADGFEIGSDREVNDSYQTYYYIAWSVGAPEITDGMFDGDGVDGRTIDTAFGPEFLLIKRDADTGAVHRSDPSLGDKAFGFRYEADFSDGIQALGDASFELGRDDRTNKSGSTYYWMAWESTPTENADIATAIIADPNPVDAGDSLFVEAKIWNQGDTDSQVTADLSWSSSLTLERSAVSQGVFTPANGNWTFSSLAAGDTATVSIAYSVDEGAGGETGSLQIQSLSSAVPDPDSSNDSATVDVEILAPPLADIKVDKGTTVAEADEGDLIEFVVGVTNTGPRDASAVRVEDALPNGLVLQSATPEVGTFVDGIWTIGDLGVGMRVKMLVEVEVAAGTAGTTITNTASLLDMDVPDPNPDNDSASASVSILGADLDLDHSVDPTEADPGDSVLFTTQITNAGPNKTGQVKVQLDYPAGIVLESVDPSLGVFDEGSDVWVIPEIGLVEPAILEWRGTVSDDAGDGSVTSTAAILSVTPVDPNPGNEEDTATLLLGRNALQVTAAVDDPNPQVGDQIRFTIDAKNTGTRTAADVRVEDLLPDEVTYLSHMIVQITDTGPTTSTYDSGTGVWVVDDLAPGQFKRLLIDAQVNAGTEGVTFANTASIVAPILDGDDQADNVASVEVTVAGADLELSHDVATMTLGAGVSSDLVVLLTNGGPSLATGVEVAVQVPTEIEVLAGSVSTGSFELDTQTWTVGVLDVGFAGELVLTVRPKTTAAGRNVTVTSLVTAGTPTDPDPDTNQASTTITVPGADLAVSMTVSDPIVAPGSEVDFVVTATNLGPDDASSIVIRDLLPSGLDFESWAATSGSYDAASGDWVMSSLVDGGSAQLTITATVSTTNTVVNQATRIASSPTDPNSRNNSASEEVGSIVADIEVETGVSAGVLYEGGTGSFIVTVTNLGPSDASDLVIEERFPSSLELTGATPSHGSYDDGFGYWSIPNLPVNDSATLDLVVAVPLGSAGDGVQEALLLSTGQVDPVSGNDGDSVSFEVRAEVDLSVELASSSSVIREGDDVTITATVENGGPSPASNVTFHVAQDPELSWASHVTSQGTFDPIAGTWTIGSLAPEGSVTLDLVLTAGTGSAGSSPNVTATLEHVDQTDVAAGNDSDALSVAIASGLVVTASQTSQSLLPAAAPSVLLTIRIDNATPFGEVVSGLSVDVRTTGAGSEEQLRSDWQAVELWSSGTELSSTEVTGDVVSFVGLSTAVPANGTRTFEIRSGASVAARDSDVLDLFLSGPDALVFTGDVPVDASWPLDPAGSFTVDGMSAAQVATPSVPSGALSAGGDAVVVGEFVVPSNGYENDVLQSVRLRWSGTAVPSDLSECALWIAGADGEFAGDGGDDVYLGAATFVGDVWTLDGLSTEVPTSGLSLYLSAAASLEAVAGHTFAFHLGVNGIEVASSNDGPIDMIVPVSGTFSIGESNDPKVTVSALPRSVQSLLPGAPTLQMARLQIANAGPGPITLGSLTLHDASDIAGSTPDADASWSVLELTVIDALAEEGTTLFATMTDGVARFEGVETSIAEGGTVEFAVLAGASTSARDGDALALAIEGPNDLVFGESVVLDAAWPLSSTAPVPVDGMSSGQVELQALQGRHVPAGTPGVLVANFRVPANGYSEDVLEALALVNLGSATSDDLARLELFAGDESLGYGEPVGSRWTWTGLDRNVPVAGLELAVWADVDSSAVPGHTMRFGLPTNPSPGLLMGSGNDGPRDAAVSHLATFEISPREGSVAVSVNGEIGLSLLPGAEPTEVLRVRVSNETAALEVLGGLTFALSSSGLGTSEQIEAGWGMFELWLETSSGGDPTEEPLDNGGVEDETDVVEPVLLGSAAVSFDEARFGDLSLYLRSGGSLELSLRSAASTAARDGDRIDPALQLEALEWQGEPTVVGLGSMDPPGDVVVDGMSAAQIVLTPVETATFEAGSVRNLALDVLVPANGYVPDRLERLDLRLEGSAQSGDIAALELWVDDGDGQFSPADDSRLGDLRLTGSRWEITGLDVDIPVGGRRFFVTVDIAEAALESRSLGFVLPSGDDVALGMESGNDGPRDAEATDGRQHVISSVDRVAFSARSLPSGTIRPGQSNVPLLHLHATNTYGTPRTVEALAIHSRATGVGTQDELDLAFEVLLLYEDSDGDGRLRTNIDQVLGASAFEDGVVTFGSLDWVLPATGSGAVFLVGRVSSRWAHDGDGFSVELSDPLDVSFSGDGAAVTGSWPLASGSSWVVDGMVASQIDTESGGTRAAGPGQGPVLAFDFTLPSNGYLPDRLESLVLENDGSATDEIAVLGLWQDGGDGDFTADEGDDVFLGTFQGEGGRWVLEGLDATLGIEENRFFAGVTAAATLDDSVSVELRIPMDGVQVASGNDGPHDAARTSPTSLYLSNAPLVAGIRTVPGVSNVDQGFTVELEVQNLNPGRVEAIQPSELEADGDGSFVVVSGPTPSTFDLEVGETRTFVWQLRGSEPGSVALSSTAEGRAQSDGSLLRSLQATSAPHELKVGAQGLSLFALGSLPSTLSYGQTGVVPLSLTFRNPGDTDGSDVQLHSIRLRIEDESGTALVPSQLVDRIVVSEGNQVYYSSTTLPGDAGDVSLAFSTPVVVTTVEPTTLNLKFDLVDLSSYTSYRVVIDSASAFSATDGTSGAGVDVTLAEGSFPIASGVAHLVSEATAVDIRSIESEDQRVGPGALDIEVLTFEATAGGESGAGADSRLGSIAVRVGSANGSDPMSLVEIASRIRVRTPLQELYNRAVDSSVQGDSLLVRFASPLTLPANTPVPITVSIDVGSDVGSESVRFALGEPGSIDARDANTGGEVPVVFETAPIEGPIVRVETPATELLLAGSAELPEQTSIGTRDLLAMRLSASHPGSEGTSRARLDAVSFQLWNEDRLGLVPAEYLTRVELWQGGLLVGETSSLPTSGALVAVDLDGVFLEPGETATFDVRIGIESTAEPGWLELTVGASQVDAFDANGGAELAILPASGSDLPVFSGLTQVTSPAREVSVDWISHLPAALVRDGLETKVGELVLVHPSTDGTGPIQFERVGLRLADGSLSDLAIGGDVSELHAYVDGALWASAQIAEAAATASLEGAVLDLAPEDELRIEVMAVFRAEGHSASLRFGIEQSDVGIVQPSGALYEIEARAKTGVEFPLFTEAGSFGTTDLRESYVNFPNPFAAGRESTTFVYYLPADGVVNLRVWTLTGDEVVTLAADNSSEAGLHQEVTWDGRNGNGETVRNGVYLVELEVEMAGGSERLLRKVAVVR
ncbi:MAG: DUF11 domain-containing protein [Candidatus Eisenbacteria bacterium]|nr:DUF11 domain-containing protein [Candidatus Eisenbacteria bacterium]